MTVKRRGPQTVREAAIAIGAAERALIKAALAFDAEWTSTLDLAYDAANAVAREAKTLRRLRARAKRLAKVEGHLAARSATQPPRGKEG